MVSSFVILETRGAQFLECSKILGKYQTISYQHCVFSDMCFIIMILDSRIYCVVCLFVHHILRSVMKYSFQNIIYQLYSVLLLLLLFLFQICCMVQFILLKPLKSNLIQFLEERWTCQSVESKVPSKLLLHTDQLMPPLEIGENWIWEVRGERIGPCNNSGGGKQQQ